MKFRELKANEIECRVNTVTANGCQILLYKNARADMMLLDETVGAQNWQRRHELINGNLFCSVGINCDGEWIWKQDVGVESYTEKEKGQASDAFKRACVNWGIGRELYTSPFIWINKNNVNIDKKENGKFTTYDDFYVKEITYKDGVITDLKIVNNKLHKVAFNMCGASEPKKDDAIENAEVRLKVMKYVNNHDVDVKKLTKYYKVKSIQDMTTDMCEDCISQLKEKGIDVNE